MKYLFLAMTEAEIRAAETLPRQLAYMACHFSPYGTGLSNIPLNLPKGSVLMLNDRTPAMGHDPVRIAGELAEAAQALEAEAVVLDLQRPGSKLCETIARECIKKLRLPVAVSEVYAKALDCPVFLSAAALWDTFKDWLAPWEGREVWAEAALLQASVQVAEDGSRYEEMPWEETDGEFLWDAEVYAGYRVCGKGDQVEVTLRRNRKELELWMEKAEQMGVTRFLGLYQQLGPAWPAAYS